MQDIVLEKVNKKFSSLDHSSFELKNISLRFRYRSFNAIVGESGSGKSSLLNILCGLELPDSGSVFFGENSANNYSSKDFFKKICYFAVDGNVIEHLTVFENMLISSNDHSLINKMLEDLGILPLKTKIVSTLSKGEMQRVGIARSLLSDRPILIFDEPTANLDQNTATKVFSLFREFSLEKTIIVATHDRVLIKAFCDEMFFIENGDIVNQCSSNNKTKDVTTNSQVIDDNVGSFSSKKIAFLAIIKKILKQKTLFFVSFFLVMISLFSVICSVTLSSAEYKASLVKSIENSPQELFRIVDEDVNGNVKPREFLEENTASQVFVMSGGDVLPDLTVTFESDVSIAHIGKKLSDYDYMESLFPKGDHIAYSPILMNSSFLRLLSNNTNTIFSIGDLLPYTFGNSNDISLTKFYIADVFLVDNIFDESEMFFPSIVKRKSYLDHVSVSGFPDFTFTESIKKIVSDFNAFCEKEGFLEEKYLGSALIPVERNLIKSSLVSGHFVDYSEIPPEGGLYVIGRLPQQLGEIVVNDYELYRRLGTYNESPADPQFEQFFEDYPGGFPMSLSSYFPDDLANIKIQIVGYYGFVNTSGSLPVPNTKGIIISDSLFDFVNQLMRDDYYLATSFYEHFLANKAFIIDNIDRVISDSIRVFNFDIGTLKLTIEKALGMGRVTLILGLVLLVITILLTVLYMNVVVKSLLSSMSLLYMNGISRFNIVFSSFLSMVTLYSVPFALAALFGLFAENIFSTAFIASTSIQGAVMVFTNPFAVLIMLSVFIFLCLLIVLPFASVSKNRILREIKKG